MNKLAVITGGTKGIGRAAAEKFAQHGFDIATCARSQNDVDNFAEEMKSFGVKTYPFAFDLSKKEEAQKFVGEVLKLGRPTDVLINNAGTFQSGDLLTEEEGSLERMITTNLYSAYYVARGIAPAMIKQKAGHIINICSVASLKAYPGGGSYAVSKFAMLGFSKQLREDLKNTGVRVTGVMPGATQTSSWDGVALPEGRLMKPEDIASAIYAAYSLSSRSVVEEILIRPQLGDV